MGSVEETKTWLLFASDCNFLPKQKFSDYEKRFDELGAKIYKLFKNWKSIFSK